MGWYFRRCAALTPNLYGVGSYNNDQTRAWVLQSGARWVRMWAQWDLLEDVPYHGNPPMGPNDPFPMLDRAIARAKNDGLGVILTNWRFPRWANQTADKNPDTYAEADRGLEGAPRLKDLEYRFPDDLTVGSPWYYWTNYLASRYNRNNPNKPLGSAWIDVLEVCNEPNLQYWPQQTPSADPSNQWGAGTPNSYCRVADMFHSAQVLQGYLGNTPLLAGPATDDSKDKNANTRTRTSFWDFTDSLLSRLGDTGFRDSPHFIWTHHNYTDILKNNANHVTQLDGLLRTRWGGFPNGTRGGNFDIWLTEGGGEVIHISKDTGIPLGERSTLIGRQSGLVRNNMENSFANQPHVYMWSQYCSYSAKCFDSGFAHPLGPDGTPCGYRQYEFDGALRPVYARFSDTGRYGNYY